MLLLAFSSALLIIYAGTILLIQSKLQALGRFYKSIARFLIIMGFLMVAGIGGSMVMHCCRGGGHMGSVGSMHHPYDDGMCKNHCEDEHGTGNMNDHQVHNCCGHRGPEVSCKSENRHCCMDGKETGKQQCCDTDSLDEKE